MENPKRITGFMAFARDMVHDTPGLTAQEVYSLAMKYSEEMGVRLSAAANPEASLVATLHKGHSDYGLERRRGRDGKLRFYPEGKAPYEDPPIYSPPGRSYSERPLIIDHEPSEKDLDCEGRCCIELSFEDTKRIRALVDLGKYSNEHYAHSDLVKKGLEVVLGSILTNL